MIVSMWYFVGIILLALFVRIHFFLKDVRRQQLEDKLLEDTQALREYERAKMEAEIEAQELELKRMQSKKKE